MKTTFTVNLYDKDGDKYEDSIRLFLGSDEISIKFNSLVELKDFAEGILNTLIPEIVEEYFHELSEEDQAEFRFD